MAELFDFMLANSDIISFHSYNDLAGTTAGIAALPDDRPLICTEYMARGHGSSFEDIMPLLAERNIGAIHWGFVSGKSQTIYPWRSWVGLIRWWDSLFGPEPAPWHHDLLREDGTPYRAAEVQFVRQVIAGQTPVAAE